MTRTQVIKILEDFNNWRRDKVLLRPNPKQVGLAIDTAVKMLKALNNRRRG